MLLQEPRRYSKPESPAGLKSWLLRGSPVPNQEPQSIPLPHFPFRVGRAQTSDLCLATSVVSSRHCEFLELGGSLFLRDTGSTNGTWVNGKRITHDTAVQEGDLVEIGDTFFRIMTSTAANPLSRTQPLPGKTTDLVPVEDTRAVQCLQQLLQNQSLLPCFQAVHCSQTGQIRGYEFLARSALHGIETAPRMFEQARRTGQEVELSLMCREQAARFSESLEINVPVFLNTHPAEPLIDTVVPQLRRLTHDYPQRQFVLEIHEAAVTEPNLIRTLRALLQEINVRLSFDDFGRGQARIRELVCAAGDYIRFDGSLLRDLQGIAPEQFSFFRSIITGIRQEGAITIAEGVETELMAKTCREIGFDLAQGYLFSRPTLLSIGR